MTLMGIYQTWCEFERFGHVPKHDFSHFPSESFIGIGHVVNALRSGAFTTVLLAVTQAHKSAWSLYH